MIKFVNVCGSAQCCECMVNGSVAMVAFFITHRDFLHKTEIFMHIHVHVHLLTSQYHQSRKVVGILAFLKLDVK